MYEGELMSESSQFDEAVRPTQWDEFVGQARMKTRLGIAIEAAIRDERQLDPVLLVGPPGTGKNTLAYLIAQKLFAQFEVIQMPVKPDRFFDKVEDMDEGVIMLDELHSAPKSFQEMLQPAIDPDDRTLVTPDLYRIDVSRILFIGATIPEFEAKLLPPLKQRFEIKPVWEPYTREEIATIMFGMASRLSFDLDMRVCDGLAGACGSTPRLARSLVKAARDLHAVGHEVTAESVLDYVGVDEDGLGVDHLQYLSIVRQQQRIGLQSLANLMGRSVQEITDLDRDLARRGFVHLSGQGRRLTQTGKAKARTIKADL